MTNYDVIVSGAGPAGCTCALFLARAGKKVLLLEKEQFPRDKICADNKSWKCLDLVKELGLWNEFEKLPKREIVGVSVFSPSGSELYTPLLEADITRKGPWYNVKRLHFDGLLATACRKEKNIQFREQCSVQSPLWGTEQVTGVQFVNEKGVQEKAFASVVVAADGSASPLATALGLSPKISGRFALNTRAYFQNVSGLQNRCELYYLKGICPGYFWIFPVDEKTCNVGLGMRPEDLARQGKTLEEKIQEVIQKKFSARFAKARQASPFSGWGVSVLGGKRKWSGNGWLLIGDAGTFAMTFSGEGVGPGMRSGKIAAAAIVQALDTGDVSASSLSRFDARMWEILAPEAAGFRWLEFLLLHERIFDWVVSRAAINPGVQSISSRMMRDYAVARELVNPKTVLRLFLGV